MKTAFARIMLAALHGKSGKTVISLGLLRALTREGLAIQPFKKGPDFVDPGWHRIASRRVSRNLDTFFMTPEKIREVIAQSARDSDVSIIEGAMGIFDGKDLEGSTSSAEIAKISNTPVILVVDTRRMTRTSAALVLGCQLFDPEVKIAGVILNRVRSKRHEELMRAMIEETCHLPVLGALPTNDDLHIPDRQLGLVSAPEVAHQDDLIDNLADIVAEHVDLEALVSIAQSAAPLGEHEETLLSASSAPITIHKQHPTIAIIRDKAFCFYYEENLQALTCEGAELAFVDSLTDAQLPDNIHALYIGGGFPEEFAEQLEANEGFRASVKQHIEANLPVYAEGGGLMYLGNTLSYRDKSYQMVGALNLDTVMQEQRLAHGYSLLEANGEHGWFERGTVLKGHEFHHSQVTNLSPTAPFAFCKTRGTGRGAGVDGTHDGLCYRNLIASYTHVNAIASPVWARQLVQQAQIKASVKASHPHKVAVL